jgi:hypothetical protein
MSAWAHLPEAERLRLAACVLDLVAQLAISRRQTIAYAEARYRTADEAAARGEGSVAHDAEHAGQGR